MWQVLCWNKWPAACWRPGSIATEIITASDPEEAPYCRIRLHR